MDPLLDVIEYADDLAFTLGLYDDFGYDNFSTFDSSVPYDSYIYDDQVPYDINSNDVSISFDIYGYGGLAPYDVFGFDALPPFDIYGYDGLVPYDVYGYVDNGIVGSVSDDLLTGSAGNDVIYGDGGFDIITGAGGNDTLIASDDGGFLAGDFGDDLLYAGFGQTFMQGDSGRDVFVLSAATTAFDPVEAHVLLDFSNTEDTLVISNTLFDEFVNLLSGADFNFIISGADTLVTANDTVITLGSNGGFLGVVVGQTPDQVASSLVIS